MATCAPCWAPAGGPASSPPSSPPSSGALLPQESSPNTDSIALHWVLVRAAWPACRCGTAGQRLCMHSSTALSMS
jgi:hypothetical protein